MKKRLANHQEVAHYWANRIQSEGQCGNVFFEGDTIYSYGYHFPVARFVNDTTVLFTTDNYSMTTSGHKSMIRAAIPYNVTVIEVDNMRARSKSEHLENILAMKKAMAELLGKANRARKYRDWYLGYYNAIARSALLYSQLFKLGYSAQSFEEKTLSNLADQIQRKKRAENKQRLARLKRKTEHFVGATLDHFKTGFDYMRLDGDQIQTARWATVPLSQAIIMYKRLKAGRDIVGKQVGYFRIFKVTDKEVVVGCHKFQIVELDRVLGPLATS